MKRRRPPRPPDGSAPPRVEEVRIRGLGSGGEGVATARDGRVLFVPGTAPGDLARVEVVEERRRFGRGRLLALLEPGPDRVEPRCPAFLRCGGCAWQHLRYGAQVAAKGRLLRDALERIGGFRLERDPPVHASPAPYGWRVRARVVADRGRPAFRARGSRRPVPVDGCPVLVPELDRRLRELAAEAALPPGEHELVAGAGGSVRVVPLASGGERLRLGVEPVDLEISPGVFAQAHAGLSGRLVEEVVRAAGRGRAVVELYAGAGLFTAGLAGNFDRLVAVEGDPAAAADLRRNLARAGARGVRVLAAAVEDALPELGGWHFDCAVLDPPRSGLGPAAREGLLALAPPRIVYVSCHAAALARDLRALAEAGGYRLQELAGFDLFPQTPHLEALALLRRGGEGGGESVCGGPGMAAAGEPPTG